VYNRKPKSKNGNATEKIIIQERSFFLLNCAVKIEYPHTE
jgi:hypothetical protein